MTPLADAKAIKNAAAGRIQSNLPTADLHRNFPLFTIHFQLDKPLFKTFSLYDKVFDSLWGTAHFCAVPLL